MKTKKKVLIIGRFSGFGGAERTLQPLLSYFCANNFEPILFLVKKPDNELFFLDLHVELDGALSRCGDRTQTQTMLRITLKLLHRIYESDLVIATSELSVTYIGWFLSKILRKPFIADIQISLPEYIKDNCSRWQYFAAKFVYPRVRYIRTISNDITYSMERVFGVPHSNMCTIPVPFDLDFINTLSRQEVYPELNQIFEHPTIVSIGRLTHQKRFDIAIEVVSILKQHFFIDVHLVLLGEGEQKKLLWEKAKALKIENNVHLIGFYENPYPILRQADVFLMTSEYEGLPRALIESLALSVPCVSVDCPTGPREILANGKWGVLVKKNDALEIAAQIVNLLNDNEATAQYKQLGPVRAMDYSDKKVLASYGNLIHRALNSE